MANNRKPRKRRTLAHGISKIPICFAIPKSQMIDLELMPWACIAAFVAGEAVAANAYTLANVANMAALLALKHSPDAQSCAKAGQDAMTSVMERGASGKWGFSGSEYQAIKDAVTLYDQMQGMATRRELRDVLLVLQEAA